MPRPGVAGPLFDGGCWVSHVLLIFDYLVVLSGGNPNPLNC